jgi:hypothetical protein
MKFSDIQEIVYNYESASDSPSRRSVVFGCECGCGGDNFTSKEWNEIEDQADIHILEAKILCTKLGIEYDGVE